MEFILVFLIHTMLQISVAQQGFPPDETNDLIRRMSPSDRVSCHQGAPVPVNRVNTSERLRLLRLHLHAERIHAYIVPSEDAHQSEYPSDFDLRRKYISGMSGSRGRAIVLKDEAALWTDGRYFIQAESELDCNWILMKEGIEGVPTETEWLIAKLESTVNATVGADPYLISNNNWIESKKKLNEKNIMLKETSNLIDKDWTTASGRPLQPNTPINALPIQFSGKSWQEKVMEIQQSLSEKQVDALVVTELDETAWLFNIRASDIKYNPFFLSYAIIERNSKHPKLFLKDFAKKLQATPTDIETKTTLMSHLKTSSMGMCNNPSTMCVNVFEYDTTLFESYLTRVEKKSRKVWIPIGASYAIYKKIPQNKRVVEKTSIAVAKAQKNNVEREGMKNAHRRDAVALISFLAKLEKEVKAGIPWTEVNAAKTLQEFRKEQLYNRGLSFGTISASGSNGAIIHYSPSNLTDKAITTKDMYLLDSGGQYLDGTTDVTRTLHFGTPTAYEKECYTRVFMGHCDLAMATWQYGLYGRELDPLARRPLWDVGLIYMHGTGHGVGMYLGVHEGPGRISLSHRAFNSDERLHEHQFFSDEPGYYEDGKFGIRLENIVVIKKVHPKYNFPNITFLGFETITLVPYEPNLLVYDMLADRQVDWLNAYNKKVLDEIGPLLQTNNELAYDWVKRRTRTITRTNTTSTSSHINFCGNLIWSMFLIVILAT